MAVKYIEGIEEGVEIEFSDVMAYLKETGVTQEEAQDIYDEIEDSVDIDFDKVEDYMKSANTYEVETVFDIIKDDVDYEDFIETTDFIDEYNHGIHDEMAIDKIKDYLSVNGVQSLAELIK